MTEQTDRDPHEDLHQMTRAPVKVRQSDSDLDRLEEARRRAADADQRWSDNFNTSRAELAFLMGAQWPGSVERERAATNRPMLTLNTLPAFADQVLGDLRQNRPSIHISPADNQDTKFVTDGPEPKEITQALVFEGLIREIEYESQADTHYDQAVQHAVESGFGWLRVLTEWVDNDTFDQDIRIKSIRGRHSVLIDPDAKEFDYSDANYAFIPDGMLRDEFEKQYPDAMVGTLGPDQKWWGDGRHVTVTEYFWRDPYKRELYLLNTGKTMWKDEFEKVADELVKSDVQVIRRRTVTQFKVWWCLCTAFEILEGPVLWPGQTIPVVPVLGKHFDTDEGPVYRGLTRYAQDAKRMHNYWMTAATERVAMAPKAPMMVTPDQIEGHEAMWANLATENYAYLLYNHVDGLQRPGREPPPTIPAAELNVALQMKDEVKSTIGMYDAALGARSNETSGKAIMARQRESDVANFAFTDNLNRAIRRVGLILVEIIPKIFDTTRIIRVRAQDDKIDRVKVNQTMDAEDGTGERVLVNDLSKGRFNVRVKSGPSYTTQREEAAEAMVEVIRADGSMMPMLGDLLFKSMDWPGADQIAERLRMGLPAHMLTQEEREKIPPPQPTPEQQAEMAKAEAMMADAEARKVEAQARMAEAQVQLQAAQGGGDLKVIIADAVAQGVAAAMAKMAGAKAQTGAQA